VAASKGTVAFAGLERKEAHGPEVGQTDREEHQDSPVEGLLHAVGASAGRRARPGGVGGKVCVGTEDDSVTGGGEGVVWDGV
jgi:hypothetical protein